MCGYSVTWSGVNLRAFVARGGKLIVTGQDAIQLPAPPAIVRFPNCPGKSYLRALERDVAGTTPMLAQEFLRNLRVVSPLTVGASPSVATHFASVDGFPHIFFANFKGLIGGRSPVQTPESGARVVTTGSARAYFLPFLGENCNVKHQGRINYIPSPD
jgi:hypothetical protein